MRFAIVLIALVALVACGATRQARDVRQSGFLGDYSALVDGPPGGALKVYKNPDADWKSYDKILLDPITIWMGVDSQMSKLSKEDRTTVANRFYSLLHARLAKDYTMVETPQPGALHVAVALTSAEHSYPVLDTVSTLLPIGLGLSTLRAVATGRPSFVGEASVEVKIVDATTGTILTEAIDSRVGTKNPTAIWSKWEDVDAAFSYWSELLGYRLCQERGATDCVAP